MSLNAKRLHVLLLQTSKTQASFEVTSQTSKTKVTVRGDRHDLDDTSDL